MSDELTQLQKNARKAFRAFYGDDDPIQFSDLTKEQRQGFEAIAAVLEDQKGVTEQDEFYEDVNRLRDDISEALVTVISGDRTKQFMRAMTMGEKAEAFDVLACALSPVERLQNRYARRPNR